MMALSRHMVTQRSRYVLFIFFFTTLLSKGQCPDKNFLEKRIVYLRDSSKFSSQQQLAELHGYLDKMQSCPYRNDSTHARLAKRIGGLYYQEADYLNAIKYYRQSIDIITANANKPSVNLTDLPGSYYWLSMMYEALHMMKERMIALDSSYKVALRIHHVDPACLRALYKWGEYFFDLGDYRRCIDYMQQCESIVKKYANLIGPEIQEEFISGSLLWQVKALLEIKQYQDAEKMLSSRIEECKRAGLNNNLGTVFSQLAELQLRKGDYNKALLFYNKAFRNDQQVGYDFNCKQTLKDIGYNIYFLHFNDANKALAYYARALAIINRDQTLNSADIAESLDLFRLIANVFTKKGQYNSAYYYFQRAFDQIRPGIDENGILQSAQEGLSQYKKIHYVTSVLIDKADSYRRQFETTREANVLRQAIRIYKIAAQFLDKIKESQSDLQSKLFWRSDSRRLFEGAIEACHLSNDADQAFYFFEKSRAVLLQDQLNEQRWLGESDIMRQTQLTKKIVQLERQLKSLDKSSSNYSALENDLFNAKQEFEDVQRLVKRNNPLYYQSFFADDTIQVRDVRRKLLTDHQALLEVFAGDSGVYLMVITFQKSILKKTDKGTFDKLTNACIGYISNENALNRNFDSFVSLSQQLQQLLFHDIKLLPGRIIISPDGKYFPFEALITGRTPLKYFVEDYAVSYTYSARFLLNNFASNSSVTSGSFMGCAPVNYASSLASLSGSDQSLQRMENYFSHPANFVRDNATKNNFLKQYYKYKIIQLYTHATDGGSTGEPVIYFADSALSLSDLFYENKPATSLIVLSACETAGGKLYNGEGVFSFNRQFAALGIPSSISNLWQANNESSYRLTELFYKYLAKGLPLDVALQSAKKEFLTSADRENKLPYFWAASILIGQSNPIHFQRSFRWAWAALFGITLVGAAWLGTRAIQRRRVRSLKVGAKKNKEKVTA